MTLPTHRGEQTGNPALDRIQNNVRAVVEYLRSLPWVMAHSYTALATDTTIGVAAYATLLTATITSRQPYLLVHLSASGVQISSLGGVYFQILVDGVVAKGLYCTVPGGYAFSVAQVLRVAVAAGPHTVTVQWKSSVANARIAPVTVNEEHASLLIQEAA